jgi:hypothetical protein
VTRDQVPRHWQRGALAVPATSIYSRSDGLVAWPACLDVASPTAAHVAVVSSHFGYSTTLRWCGRSRTGWRSRRVNGDRSSRRGCCGRCSWKQATGTAHGAATSLHVESLLRQRPIHFDQDNFDVCLLGPASPRPCAAFSLSQTLVPSTSRQL